MNGLLDLIIGMDVEDFRESLSEVNQDLPILFFLETEDGVKMLIPESVGVGGNELIGKACVINFKEG